MNDWWPSAWAPPQQGGLVEAVASGSVGDVDKLIAGGADVDAPDVAETRALPIVAAAMRGDHEVVSRLVAAGADVSKCTTHHRTALVEAANRGHEDTVKQLIGAGANVNDNKGIFLDAAYSNKTAILKLLIAGGADVNVEGALAAGEPFVPALALACVTGEREAIDVLLAAGAKPTAAALLEAAANGHLDVFKLLVAAGADPSDYFTDRMNGNVTHTPLMIATRGGRVEIVKFLVSEGVDVNATNSQGRTALMFCRRNRRPSAPEVTSLLLSAGADVNAQDSDGLTPLMAAVTRMLPPSAISQLLSAGADVNLCGREDWTTTLDRSPVYRTAAAMAARHGRPDALSLLIAAGADVNVEDDNGETPIMLAALEGNDDVIRQLIAAGADIDARRFQSLTTDDSTAGGPRRLREYTAELRSTALICAASNRNYEAAECLVDGGADVNAYDAVGRTALHYACDANFDGGQGFGRVRAGSTNSPPPCRDIAMLLVDGIVNAAALDW